MSRFKVSLTTRVSAFFLATLAVVLVGFSTTLYLLSRAHLHRDLDEQLTAVLDTLTWSAEVDSDKVDWHPGTRPPNDGAHPHDDSVRWAVFDGRGTIRDHSRGVDAGDFAEALKQAPDFGHVHLAAVGRDGESWRMVVRRVLPGPPDDDDKDDDHPARRGRPDARADSSLIVATGAPMGPKEAGLSQVAWILVGLSTGLWLLAAAAGRSLCRRALGPVSWMATAAAAMTAADRNQRLPSPGTGDEIEDLARSFNGLLGRLHEAIARQERFAGDASHQLRTPLTALISEVEVTRRRDRSPQDYRDCLDRIHDDATRLRQIVEALLFLAHADSQAALPGLDAVDLSAWLPEHLRHWSGHPRTADILIDDPTGGPLLVQAQSSLLGQLVDNLLDNACKYSPPGTPIRVRLGRERGSATLAVEDRGEGLAPDDLAHIFDPFYRSPRARLRGTPGSGLGLAVVQRIAASFGGSVTAENVPGPGSLFTLRLPERPATRAPLESAGRVAAPLA
jgi:heavy metal sensor kinase